MKLVEAEVDRSVLATTNLRRREGGSTAAVTWGVGELK